MGHETLSQSCILFIGQKEAFSLDSTVLSMIQMKPNAHRRNYTVILQNLLFKDFPNCKVWTDKPTKDTKFNFKEESYLKKDFSGGMHIRKFTWVYILTLTLTRRG